MIGEIQKTDQAAERHRQITEGPIIKALLRLALPVILSNLFQSGYHLINMFWVGRLGAEAVAAIAISGPLIFMVFALSGGLAVAATVFVGQYFGAHKQDKVNHTAAQATLMMVGFALIITTVGYFSVGALLPILGVEQGALDDSTAYLKVSYVGINFALVFMMFQAILQGVGEVRFPLYVISVSVLLNVLLDPLLIFGWGPIPAYGVVGSAYATVFSQVITAIVALIALFSGKFGVRLELHNLRPDFTFIRRLVSTGFPASIEHATRTFSSLLLTTLAAGFGTVALAGYGVGMRVIAFFFLPGLGLAAATAAVVAQNIGAGKPGRAVEAARLSGWIGFLWLSVLGLMLIPAADAITRFMVPADADVARLGADFIMIVAPVFGVIIAQQALAGAFRGAGDTRSAMVLSLMTQWLVQLPVSYILTRHTSLGLAGIWWGFPIANVLSLAATIYWFRRGSWRSKVLMGNPPPQT